MRRTRPRLCFAASSGGHLEELLMLRPLMERYDSFIVTEKTAYAAALNGVRCRYLLQVNRRQRSCLPRMALNAAHSLLIRRSKGNFWDPTVTNIMAPPQNTPPAYRAFG